MTDNPAPTQEIIEHVGGVALPDDRTLHPKRIELSLPELPVAPTSWDLIAHATTLARLVSASEFVPKQFRNRPAAVAAAILLGAELGLPPMSSLQRIKVTDDGLVLVEAQAMRASVLSKGHRLWVSEYSSHRVTVNGQRRGEEDVFTVTWTLDDCKRAGLAGKPMYGKYPRQMLMARATAELCRIAFADCLGGIAYAREEFDDGLDSIRDEEGNLPPVEDPVAPTHTRRRRGAAEPPTVEQAAAEPSAGTSSPRDAGSTGMTTRQAASSGSEVSTPPAPPSGGMIPVPGDDVPEAVAPTVPPPAASPSPPPTASASSAVSVDASGQATLDVALDKFPAAPEMQQSAATPHVARKEIEHLATLCREAKIDRHAVAQAVSGGRTESTRSLTPQEVANALDRVRAVQRGEVRLTVDLGPGEVPRFEGVDEDADLNLGLLTRLKAYRDADEHGFWQLLTAFGWKAGVTNTTVTEFVKALTREQRLAMYDRVPQ